MIRKWVKILPYFMVKRIVKWLECTVLVHPKEKLYLWVIDDGEYLLFSEKKYKEMKNKEEEKRQKKRQKKLKKARKKIMKAKMTIKEILREFPELEDEINK